MCTVGLQLEIIIEKIAASKGRTAKASIII
jgi:hypothetical protein